MLAKIPFTLEPGLHSGTRALIQRDELHFGGMNFWKDEGFLAHSFLTVGSIARDNWLRTLKGITLPPSNWATLSRA